MKKNELLNQTAVSSLFVAGIFFLLIPSIYFFTGVYKTNPLIFTSTHTGIYHEEKPELRFSDIQAEVVYAKGRANETGEKIKEYSKEKLEQLKIKVEAVSRKPIRIIDSFFKKFKFETKKKAEEAKKFVEEKLKPEEIIP